MKLRLEDVFRTATPARDKYLSRLFGLFSEDVVRYWCAEGRAPYEDLGRPTLWSLGATRGHTLDFTLRGRKSARVFVAELKCELEFEGYKYLRLESPAQLVHHSSPAFRAFSTFAKDQTRFEARLGGRPIRASGAILVWGAVTPEGRSATAAECGFADVLSIEEMIRDLATWGSASWVKRVDQLRSWSGDLFDYLSSQRDGKSE